MSTPSQTRTQTETEPETGSTEDVPLRGRIAATPRPALLWVGGVVLLVAIEFGALAEVLVQLAGAIAGVVPGIGAEAFAGLERAASEIPTVLNREVIPNEGYYNGRRWVNTFLGLEPKHAWLVRVSAIYAYAAAWIGWIWVGYRWFRAHYRYADWTPRDDVVDRLRTHRWGQFGFVVVVAFLVLAIFAPALGPTTLQKNIIDPYSYDFKYYSESSDTVLETQVGVANLQSTSKGAGGQNVGPWSYDEFGRFHPFGTMTTGKDLFTFMAAGSRISLGIGIVSLTIAGTVALAFALLTAYYKGLADLAVVVAGDSVMALPFLLIIILAGAVFQGTPIASAYSGALLLTILFATLEWPYLWRAIRGPAFQVSEGEWIDAAESYGQRPLAIMQKHMLPYVVGYLLIYASLTLGGIIISIAALSFLGLGINPPTPEWGFAVNEGRQYVASVSWHISLVPGILITIVVVGFNALGDGIRDAIDPESGADEGAGAAAAGGGG